MGNDNPETLKNLNNIARIMDKLGYFNEAVEVQKELIKYRIHSSTSVNDIIKSVLGLVKYYVHFLQGKVQ